MSDLNHFYATALNFFENETPIRMKFVRGNEAPFMNRAIKRAIIRNKILKNPTNKSNMLYKKQIVFVLHV